MLYLHDNNDVFPFFASSYGPLPADWIYWRPNLPQYPIQNSPIAVELSQGPGMLAQATNPAAALLTAFKCPADQAPYGPARSYPYSYTLNNVSEALAIPVVAGPMQVGNYASSMNFGFSSCGYDGPPWAYFKGTQVRNAAQKMMLSEQPYAPYEAPGGYGVKSVALQCGQWEPLVFNGGTGSPATETFRLSDVLTIRHSGRANVTFGDGHVATAYWWQATNADTVVAAY